MNVQSLDPPLAHRDLPKPPTGVILHATAGSSVSGAIETLRKEKLSYHAIIAKDGSITKCVPYGKRAFHAGVSAGWQGRGCNLYTIGISFVNLNDGRDRYTDEQFEAACELILALKRQHPTLRYLSTHRLVSPGRKTDPLGFDAPRLARETELAFWAGKGGGR